MFAWGVDADAVQDVGHCGVPFGGLGGDEGAGRVGVSAGTRRAWGVATEVSAASVAKTTQDHRAGWNPSVTAVGLVRLPWAEKTALAIAIAKTAPKRWAM